MTTLMLIDGNSLTYRAFFALPTDMATASGQVTNAVFGFTSMLVNLLRDQKPDHLAVVFDRSEPTFRHEALSTYKGNRDATPDLLRQQMGITSGWGMEPGDVGYQPPGMPSLNPLPESQPTAVTDRRNGATW